MLFVEPGGAEEHSDDFYRESAIIGVVSEAA